MKRVGNIISFFKSELYAVADEREIISWAYIVIKYIFKFNRSECIINSDKVLTEKEFSNINKIINKLKLGKPIQQILNESVFFGMKLKINKYVLIPRRETEELVNWILQDTFKTAIDICTGSGCIAIALAKHSKSSIVAVDVCVQALKIARENAILHNVEIEFSQKDILKTYDLPKSDLIVSNPPYVMDSEKKYLNSNVLKYEPHLALFVLDKRPLLFYKRIIYLASKSLNKNGRIYFEINEKFGNQIYEILCKNGFVDIELKKDINDKFRMIKAVWK